MRRARVLLQRVEAAGGGERTGKLTPDAIHELATKRHDIHYPKPRAVTITQSTETGRVYTAQGAARDLSEACRAHGLSLHMDGARFANACASLGCSPAEMSWKSGVDVLCFGGAKNGMAMGEAVLFFDRGQAADFDYRCKQAGQLASKMRFLSAPWVGMLESGAWLRNAAHANQCARQFAAQIDGIPGVRLAQPVEANAVFLEAAEEIFAQLRARGWSFYNFIGGAARFMFAWDSDLARVDALVPRSAGMRGCGATCVEVRTGRGKFIVAQVRAGGHGERFGRVCGHAQQLPVAGLDEPGRNRACREKPAARSNNLPC